VVAAILVTVTAGLVIISDKGTDPTDYVLIASIDVALLAGLFYHEAKPPNALIAATRDAAPTWLRRNLDGLITNATVSAVFLAIGIIIGRSH